MTTRIMSKSISSAGAGGSGLGGIPSNSRAPPTASTTTTTTAAAATSATTSTTTITSDPGILCFHHCNVKVFCFTLPHICPQCKTALDTHPSSGLANKRHKSKKRTSATNNAQTATTTKGHYGHRHGHDVNNANKRDNHDDGDDQWHNGNDQQHQATMDQDNDDKDDDEDDNDSDDEENSNDSICRIMDSRLLPFRLPYPFVRANQYPCAIVLRPTTGDFLNDYNNTTDLHIAVTTSTGCVVEFDRHGLRRHRTANMSDWWQCLLVGDVPEPWYDYWDQVLFEVCQQPDKWTVSHYHEDKHNCYTFVLTFLQALTYDKLSEAASSKTTFCEKYIVPRTTTAGKYISLYRKLRDTGIYVHHTNHNKLRYGGGGGAGAGSSSSRSKMGKHHQQHYQQQEHKFNNSGITSSQIATPTTTKSSMLSSSKHQMQQQQQHQQHPTQNQNHQQQQQQHQHHHNSIISRPHSKLCTIEE